MAISLIKITDTFNTFMDGVNSIINKINNIDVDSNTVKLNQIMTVGAEPADADLEVNQALIYVDGSGKIKVKYRNSTTVLTKTVDYE